MRLSSLLNQGLVLMLLLFAWQPVQAESSRLKVVVSFSILADLVAEVGGERVELHTLVGADSDAHVYQARPSDVKTLRGADILVVNGLGFEGWLNRLQQSAGFEGLTLVAGEGVHTLDYNGHDHHDIEHHEEHHDEHEDHHDEHVHEGHHDEHDGHHDEHAHEEHHDEHQDELADPHIWHDIERMILVVDNIRNGLIQVDPAGAELYQRNAEAYKAVLKTLNMELQALVAQVPEAQRKVITTHDAFNYLSDAFAIEFLSAQGISTESEPSARDVAQLIRQIREHQIKAVFAENISDDRLIKQISRETGAVIGGVLYSGALSAENGPAGSYVAMMRHNITTLVNALRAE